MQWIAYVVAPFLLSMALTPIVKWIAVRLDIYAQINERTVHNGKIARVGGISIFVAFMVCMAFFSTGIDDTVRGLLLGCIIIFAGGIIDDMLNLKPIIKLAFEISAAVVLMYVGGVHLNVIHLPLDIVINMGFISLLVTFVWIIGITNAINLIDGLDGLAGGVSTIILFTIASVSFLDQRTDITMLCLVLAGAILGFLVFNVHPASIFMGDCGALFLGFFISAISLMGFKSSTFITLGFPILLLSVPIIDTLSAMIRRTLKGQSFTSADKNHFHHALMRRFGHRNTVWIIYLITIGFGVSAYLYIVNQKAGLIMILVIFFGLELFIEKSQMISAKYHPFFGAIRRIKKLFRIKK